MDPSRSQLGKLLEQCKSNDVDAKVDALTKLEAEFAAATELDTPDALINTLKTCLRTANIHLTTATVSAIPPFILLLFPQTTRLVAAQTSVPRSATSSTSSTAAPPLLDIPLLRQVLNAFLSPGGLFERLGDREKIQMKAREAIVILGGLAFRSGGSSNSMSFRSKDAKSPETPLMIFERFLLAGLTSKVWKVREQSIMTLTLIRRDRHQFPLRPFVSSLVDCLEDTDAHVRDCARTSIIELFSGPATTDAARSDLKKEMTKKGVRKTIVDSVLAKLMNGGGAGDASGSENDDSKPAKQYIPPSIALQMKKPVIANMSRTTSMNTPRPPYRAAAPATPSVSNDTADIMSVFIVSNRDLENEFHNMQAAFEGKETEHNWAARERAIVRVRGMIKGDVYQRFADVFLSCLREGFIQWSLKALASLRTTVAVHTCSLYSELATALGPMIDPFCEILLTNLLKMAGFTKKITAHQSQATVEVIIRHMSPQPRLVLSLLWQHIQDKSPQTRTFAISHLKVYLSIHVHRAKSAIEASGMLETLEKAIKKSVSDVNPATREAARTAFWIFEEVWPDCGTAILQSVDSVTRTQVEKACPDPNRMVSLPAATPVTKKSSVAAAIAASRAKARVIANAPPTLRHQATSASSHTPLPRRPASPSTSTSTSVSPPSPRSRVVTGPPHPPLSPSRIRTASGPTSTRSPPSRMRTSSSNPSVSPSNSIANPRRTSSPLVPQSSSTQSVLQTPSSPPSARQSSKPHPYLSLPRQHVPQSSIVDLMGEDSLLLAQSIPIPEDDFESDSEIGSSQMLSFSSRLDTYVPLMPKPLVDGNRRTSGSKHPAVLTPTSNSVDLSTSPKSNGSVLQPHCTLVPPLTSTLSSDSVTDMMSRPAVEDAMRARAEQAESAAERLLELVEPDEDGMGHSPIPSSLLVGNGGNGLLTPKPKIKSTSLSLPMDATAAPVTPVNRVSTLLRQAAMFKDSPAHNQRSTSLLDVLQERKHETGWWLKRKNLVAKGAPLKGTDAVDRMSELQRYVKVLEGDEVNVQVLQKLALLCIENPVTEALPSPTSTGYPGSPSPFYSSSRSIASMGFDIWSKDQNFERLLAGLLRILEPTKDEEELEYALIVLWEILDNQMPLIDGQEADIFSAILQIDMEKILEATNSIRDAITTRIEPVYGLTTLHAALRLFCDEPYPEWSTEEAKSTTYAFGLIALGKFILRLPAEIAEEEIPRLRAAFISALNDKSSLIVRESAAAAIIAAQVVLQDETHLFALLDGLADEKKNLLTYLFDKHGARGSGTKSLSSTDKLEKEMRRLDTRTSTPPRQGAL
ncbi:hypothetical protein FISHEDRAFT_72906 [Fistulina hepatica ATCC 64428]|nr:hypothetical protein FISHEDRAFT_72906 [Fistulina hepatica ATCC 64428]